MFKIILSVGFALFGFNSLAVTPKCEKKAGELLNNIIQAGVLEFSSNPT